MPLIICSPRPAQQLEFFEFWSEAYDYPDDQLYARNIGRPLTDESIRELFRWKNGTPLSASKQKSVETNFVQRRLELLGRAPDEDPKIILRDLGEGRPIWRIFWLHCWQHRQFPIFDQHVFRAMSYIEDGEVREIPSAAAAKVEAYFDRYIPFYGRFQHDRRMIDKALWSFGRALRYPWFAPRD